MRSAITPRRWSTPTSARSPRPTAFRRGASRSATQIAEAIALADTTEEGPVLVEFVVEQEDIVYPMVPAGADLDAMLRRPAPGEEVEMPKKLSNTEGGV